MEYRVNGTVRVWFSTVVEAESAEEARENILPRSFLREVKESRVSFLSSTLKSILILGRKKVGSLLANAET